MPGGEDTYGADVLGITSTRGVSTLNWPTPFAGFGRFQYLVTSQTGFAP